MIRTQGRSEALRRSTKKKDIQYNRRWRTQQIHDALEGVFALPIAGAQHTHKCSLRLGARFTAVAAPGLGCDHGGAHFRSPALLVASMPGSVKT
jgi:hypothetical protein